MTLYWKKLNECYLTYQDRRQEYKQFRQLGSNQDKIALLTFQLEEIQNFNPLPNEYGELHKTHLLLSNAEATKSDCNTALEALSHAQANAQQLIDLALNAIRKYNEDYPNLKRATELLDDAQNLY